MSGSLLDLSRRFVIVTRFDFPPSGLLCSMADRSTGSGANRMRFARTYSCHMLHAEPMYWTFCGALLTIQP